MTTRLSTQPQDSVSTAGGVVLSISHLSQRAVSYEHFDLADMPSLRFTNGSDLIERMADRAADLPLSDSTHGPIRDTERRFGGSVVTAHNYHYDKLARQRKDQRSGYLNTHYRLEGIRRFSKRLPSSGGTWFGCWPMKTRRAGGYAVFGDRGRLVPGEIYAHRIVATIVWGPIPPGYEVDHMCRTRNCVNPFHLRICTVADNRATRVWTPKTVCPQGHVYAEVGRTKQGRCRTCQNLDTKAYRVRVGKAS